MKKSAIWGIVGFAAFMIVAVVMYNSLGKKITPEVTQIPSASSENSGTLGESQSEEVDYTAPDFTVYDKDGNAVKLTDFFGKPIVLNFWASWCPPCKSEMPDFEKLYQEVGEEVQFLMVNMVDGGRETKAKGQKFVEDKGFTFPVYYDTMQDAAYTYGVTSLPTSIFIDKEGQMITGFRGAMTEKQLRERIDLIYNKEETSERVVENVENPSWCTVPPEYIKIDAENAKMMSEQTDEVIFLDVRTLEEYNEGHIEGAVLLPDTELAEKIEQVIPDKRALVFVYCRSGNRSKTATEKMVELGYNHVYDMGGINDAKEFFKIVK